MVWEKLSSFILLHVAIHQIYILLKNFELYQWVSFTKEDVFLFSILKLPKDEMTCLPNMGYLHY